MNDEPKKIFTLQPVEDDFKKRIVRARELVCEDHELNYGARVLYCRLVDLGFLDSFTLELGAVDMRFSELARRIGCSERVLAYWRDELIARGHIWCSQKLRRNMYPSTIWHISAMDPPKIAPAGHLDRDGGAPFAPYLHKSNVFKTRGFRGRFAKNAAASGNPLPLPAVNSAAASGTPLPLPAVNSAAASGNPLPLPAANSAAASGTPLPLPAERPCGLMESPRLFKGKRETQGGRPPPKAAPKAGKNWQDTEFATWQAKLGRLFPRELRDLRSDLVRDLAKVVSTPAKSAVRRKIQAVDSALKGPAVTEDDFPAPPAPKAPVPAKPITEEELLSGARYLVQTGKTHLLTEPQKAALAATQHERAP